MKSNSSFTLSPEACPIEDTSIPKVPLSDLTSKRACDLFERRGRGQSHELEDCLKAEHEIKHHFGLERTNL